MYDILKALFGIPHRDAQGFRINIESPNASEDISEQINETDGEENSRIYFEDNTDDFDFPTFSYSMDIHKYFESIINEMHKKFEVFGFHESPGVAWQDNFSSTFYDEETRKPKSLRDSFLKNPGYVNDKNLKEDVNLDDRVKVDEVETLLRQELESFKGAKSIVQQPSPKAYSKSVYIRTVIKPDGSVETIKKVQDHTGKEETIVTQNNSNDLHSSSPNNQLLPRDDISGISIFKKFFRF